MGKLLILVVSIFLLGCVRLTSDHNIVGKILFYLMIGAVALCTACSESSTERAVENEATSATRQVTDTVVVDTATVLVQPLTIDVVSNGRIRASETADIYFRSPELISQVYVKNGQHVQRGQQLASLDITKLENEKKKIVAELEQAKLDMQDVLIGQGYDPAAMSTVPAEVLELARIRSGLAQAEASFAAIVTNIGQSTITAPFAGTVVNVCMTRHSMAKTSDPFCRIINVGSMEVAFTILESELAAITVGTPVEIVPFNGGMQHTGYISTINPVVDENGHVTVTAAIKGGQELLDGMNVRVRSRKSLGNRLIVPKSAVVLRTGRQVVFTYEDGMAKWNYVATGFENLDGYEITDGLEPRQTIIITGNETLTHNNPVSVGNR